MALYLARHGVKVSVTQKNGNGDAGDTLLSHAHDSGADLLVMGCYGHARFRETFVGGVTDTVLRSMTLPVLMAH
jgi:nucleotide-binding universal stress UspA family protein